MTTIPEPRVDPLDRDRAAFECTAAARATVTPEEAARYSLDATYAVGRAEWIAARLAPYRAQIATLPNAELAELDDLVETARALAFVNTAIQGRIERARQLPELASEGWRLRAMLMSYAEALSYKGHLPTELIARLREGSGYADLVEDLRVLVQQLAALPTEKVGAATAVTREDLERAKEIADQIGRSAGMGPEADLTQAELQAERRKLGVLLLRVHSQILRAMVFLRWTEGDANELVPSLYVPGGPRKPAAKAPTEADELATLHEKLHDHMTPAAAEPAAPLAPEDNPFSAE